MKIKSKTQLQTQKMVLSAAMTAIVAVVQVLASYTAIFGPFASAIALVPIVIGAALCGPAVGGWLGLVFGGIVLITGQAALFWPFNEVGTIITVLVKGVACGVAAGVVYRLLERFNRYVAVLAAAIICPAVNTGVFLLGSAIFFMDSSEAMATALEMDISGMAFFWALAMANFLFEIGINVVLSPTVVRIINIKKGKKRA